jgi:hypothetical protein
VARPRDFVLTIYGDEVPVHFVSQREIVRLARLDEINLPRNASHLHGLYRPATHAIYIWGNTPRLRATLFHEIGHVVHPFASEARIEVLEEALESLWESPVAGLL